MNIARRLLFVLVSLICMLSIISYPINKYEWMLEEDPHMSLKSLPIDNNATTYPWLAIAPILLLVMCIMLAKSKQEKKVIILVGVILLCVWAYRFRSLLF